MKKKVSNSIFLLALCMQYGSGKVEAMDSTIAEAYVPKKEQNDLTGRLLVAQAKFPGYQFTEKQLDKMHEFLADLHDVLEDKDEVVYKARQTVEQKKKHVENKITEAVQAFKGKKLEPKEMKKASRLIGDIENTFLETNVKKNLRHKR